jgi:glycosyltransferase involved in cell wall biosynthesis
MKVVYLHYHLNPGGVTRVIELQIESIQRVTNHVEIRVLCGYSGPTTLGGVNVLRDKVLDYLDPGRRDCDYRQKASEIEQVIRKSLGKDTLLHVHNPNLGKNPALTAAIYRVAADGFPIVNHCHDFAEDRPANLAGLQQVIPDLTGLDIQQVLYPCFPRYHFIVLNSSDYNRVLREGVPLSRVHLLPNAVSEARHMAGEEKNALRKSVCQALGLDPRKKICTYPVRAIARKNLGEYILLAVLFSGYANFTVTQPPKNPLELPLYNHWKEFCHKNNLELKFEAGDQVKYEELVNISDFCITTSIREGFGMVYLEPWLSGTPVIGRELAMVTDDLKNYGLHFPRLYSSLLVETRDGIRDFKDLEQEEQEDVIVKVITRPEMKRKVFYDNPALSNFLDDISPGIIAENQEVIRKKFSTERYGKELYGIYQKVSE